MVASIVNLATPGKSYHQLEVKVMSTVISQFKGVSLMSNTEGSKLIRKLILLTDSNLMCSTHATNAQKIRFPFFSLV